MVKENRKSQNKQKLIRILCLCLVCSSVSGFFANDFFIADILDQFQFQYFVCFLILALYLALTRDLNYIAIAVTGVAFNIAPLIYILQPESNAKVTTKTESFRLLQWQLPDGSLTPAEASKYVKNSNADIVGLVNMTDDATLLARSMRKSYPHTIFFPNTNGRRIQIFSRYPVTTKSQNQLEHKAARTFATAQFKIGEKKLEMMMIKAGLPTQSRALKSRNARIAAAYHWLKNRKYPAIVAGNLGATPWSRTLKSVIADKHIFAADMGRGWQPTWSLHRFLKFFSIPTDLTLHNRFLSTTGRSTSRNMKSNHQAIITDFSI